MHLTLYDQKSVANTTVPCEGQARGPSLRTIVHPMQGPRHAPIDGPTQEPGVYHSPAFPQSEPTFPADHFLLGFSEKISSLKHAGQFRKQKPSSNKQVCTNYIKGKMMCPFPGFLHRNTSSILGQIILCGGSCPVYCGMFSSVLGLQPLDASSISPQSQQSGVSRYCQMTPGKMTESSPQGTFQIHRCFQILPNDPWIETHSSPQGNFREHGKIQNQVSARIQLSRSVSYSVIIKTV